MKICYDVDGKIFDNEEEAKRYEDIVLEDKKKKEKFKKEKEKIEKEVVDAYNKYLEISTEYVDKYGYYSFLNIPF